jgi:selenocysteine-specific elongation factor
MPQTREHLDICTLLGVRRGLVVLTKIDLVDQELRDLAIEDIQGFTRGTFLEKAPIIPVSAVTGEGIGDLVQALERVVEEVDERASDGLFRLPIDRVFVMKGFGTVLTGTLLSGRVKTGEAVEILPTGILAKVRGLQVHNEKVEQAVAGQRTAINLQGVEKSSIERGEVLVHPGTVEPTTLLDVEVIHLSHASRPLRHGVMLRFHTGTSLQMAKIFLLGAQELKPGERGYAHIRLQDPVVALPNDHFVLRGSSLIQTVGGGQILDAHPQRHKRFKGDFIAPLEQLKGGDPAFIIGFHIRKGGNQGLELRKLAGYTNIAPALLRATLDKLLSHKGAIKFDREAERVIDGGIYNQLKDEMVDALKQYHAANPLKPGIPKEELKSRLPADVDAKLFNALFTDLVKDEAMVQEKDKVRLAGHRISLEGGQQQLEEKIEAIMLSSNLAPPSPKELGEQLKASEQEVLAILSVLVNAGKVAKLKGGVYFHQEPLDKLQEALIAFLKEKGRISTQDLKALTGVSRKYAIPLAEYFDAMKVTVRVGDDRILRGSGKE